MKIMRVGIMGVAETSWDKEGSFLSQLPKSEVEINYYINSPTKINVTSRQNCNRSFLSGFLLENSY